jgi:hypothetical protein
MPRCETAAAPLATCGRISMASVSTSMRISASPPDRGDRARVCDLRFRQRASKRNPRGSGLGPLRRSSGAPGSRPEPHANPGLSITALGALLVAAVCLLFGVAFVLAPISNGENGPARSA